MRKLDFYLLIFQCSVFFIILKRGSSFVAFVCVINMRRRSRRLAAILRCSRDPVEIPTFKKLPMAI